MPVTSPRRAIALPLAGLPPALAAGLVLATAGALANDRDLRGTPVPAAACVEYHRSPALIEDPWTAGYFGVTGDARDLQLRCPFPVNNVDLSGKTNHNRLSKLRVHYRDSDGFGGGAAVQVVVVKTSVSTSGTALNEAVCFWSSNAHGTGATTTVTAIRPCVHDLAAGAFYSVDVLLQSRAGHTAQFLGVDFP
jgi:hypothetical protein